MKREKTAYKYLFVRIRSWQSLATTRQRATTDYFGEKKSNLYRKDEHDSDVWFRLKFRENMHFRYSLQLFSQWDFQKLCEKYDLLCSLLAFFSFDKSWRHLWGWSFKSVHKYVEYVSKNFMVFQRFLYKVGKNVTRIYRGLNLSQLIYFFQYTDLSEVSID